ncbi:uncharacterized protein [Drosophila bipectinata]|uniref:uncharacterized protein n=1 Tax=Drosophila bipectinata TaxID=42026 RepID=UPI001C8AC835|nr:uncharacterized protein LOC108132038 isoform X1 [Drosophila bipectinata]
MSLFSIKRRILLLVLLFSGPLGNAPFRGAQVAIAQNPKQTSRDRQNPTEWRRYWEWDPAWESKVIQPPPQTTSREFDDLYPDADGSPLPKSSGPEINNQLDADYFPPYPELLDRQWHLQNLKQLQVQQKWQSPPAALGKRAPIQWPPPEDSEEQQPPEGEPRYPFAYAHTLPWKRKQVSQPQKLRYKPSISAGAMTNLGDFFNQLEANVRFAEQSQLGESETRLLEGKHPHPMVLQVLPTKAPIDAAQQEEQDLKTSKLLHALRSYRPSQKIRSLVSRNPQGYRGSQFIDPSYMWLGLGK